MRSRNEICVNSLAAPSDVFSFRLNKRVEGHVEKEETWEDELERDTEKKKTFVLSLNSAGGKSAITKITPLKHSAPARKTLVMAEIVTGRTHQIRAQAGAHGHPLAGDLKYGGHSKGGGKGSFFLHAWKLEFLEYSITAPLPEAFRKKAESLFGFLIPL